MNEQSPTNPKERVLKVFEFLKACTELRYPPIRDIGQQLRFLRLKNLPAHPSVELFRNDGEIAHESENADIVLQITRPDLTPCPPPPKAIAEWLKPGWHDIDGNVKTYVSCTISGKDGQTTIEKFEDTSKNISSTRLLQNA